MKWRQITLGLATAVLGWYAMMAIHEMGHCLGALMTGARVDAVALPLAGFSRTDVSGGGHPLVVVWAGPVFGATAPLLLLPFLRFARRTARHAMLFFAGFCLLVNGAYIGAGGFMDAGDCHEMLRHGSPLWLLVGFGAAAFAGGLCAWHRMGPLGEWFAPEVKKGTG